MIMSEETNNLKALEKKLRAEEIKRVELFTAKWQERLSGLKPALELIACTRTKKGLKELDMRLKWWVDAYPNHAQLDSMRECYKERRHDIYENAKEEGDVIEPRHPGDGATNFDEAAPD
jgi:hypothetical protein